MKNKFLICLFVIISVFGCKQKESKKENLTVKGEIKGLRAGTLSIKKIDNDTVKTIDSVKVDGNENFEFHININEPQILILELKAIKDGQILFFAAPEDTIRIYTFLEKFAVSPVILGGINQRKWQEYNEMLRKFGDKEISLFKEKFEASKQGNNILADSLKKAYDRLMTKKQLYKLNFVFSNKDKPIGAYVGFTEFYHQPKILDTIYKILDKDVQKNKYAIEIKKILNNIQEN